MVAEDVAVEEAFDASFTLFAFFLETWVDSSALVLLETVLVLVAEDVVGGSLVFLADCDFGVSVCPCCMRYQL